MAGSTVFLLEHLDPGNISNKKTISILRMLSARKGKQKSLPVRESFFRRLNCTWDGNRTHTSVTAHGILSPACLPVPPPKRPGKTKSTNGAFSF